MIAVDALKESVKRINQLNRKHLGRDEKLDAKRKQIDDLDKQVRDAKSHDAMNDAMKKLNRARAALDRITETGHDHNDQLAEELDKLVEMAKAERAKL